MGRAPAELFRAGVPFTLAAVAQWLRLLCLRELRQCIEGLRERIAVALIEEANTAH